MKVSGLCHRVGALATKHKLIVFFESSGARVSCYQSNILLLSKPCACGISGARVSCYQSNIPVLIDRSFR